MIPAVSHGAISRIARMRRWFGAQRRTIGVLTLGHAANQAVSLPFDYLLYPVMLLWLGAVFGGAIMTALSAVVCYLLLAFYSWSGTDWLGIELVRGLRDGPKPQSRALRVLRRILRAGRLPALVVLSIKFDPFITVLYLREGPIPKSGLTRADWIVFGASIVLSNLYWIGAWSVVIEVGLYLAQRIGISV